MIASFGGPAIDGRVNRDTGRGIDNPEGRAAIASLPAVRPDMVALCSGIRGGKSLICATTAVRASQTCDVSKLGPGEVPRIPIVATSMDIARPTWDVLVGRVLASPKARELVLDEPTTEKILLRHPTGRPIEIKVVAGARAASTLVARWLACAIFDESTRMVGEADGVVNLDEMLKAIRLRMLPGAQILLPGSPWAPYGPVYNIVQEHFGRPSKKCVVLRSSGPMMNPFIWDAEKVEEAKKNPDEWRVDGIGDFMNPESGMFSEPEFMACRREGPVTLPPHDQMHYSAAIDPATRGNAWTLVIIGKSKTKIVVVLARQWIGSATAPLSPKAVFAEIAPIVAAYRTSTLFTDEWAADALREHASDAGIWLASEPTAARAKLEHYTAIRGHMAARSIEFPPDAEFQRDVVSVRKVTTQTSVAIVLPKTSDGRHCDYMPPLAQLMGHIPRIPDDDPLPAPGTLERQNLEEADRKERARLEVVARQRQNSRDWRRVNGLR